MNICIVKYSVLFLIIQICYGKRLYYLDEYKTSKNKTITLESSKSKDSYVVLRASDNSSPKEGDYAFSILPPDGNHRILGSVIWYKTPREDPKSEDSIQIISSNGSKNNTHYSGDTKNMPRSFYMDETAGYNRLIIELKIKNSRVLRKFEIVLTAARNCNGKDNKDDFACENSYCINEDLKCDQRNNCGDNSDEAKKCKRKRVEYGFTSFKIGTPKISWIIALVFLTVCAAAIGFFFYRRRRNANSGAPGSGTSIMSVLTGNNQNAYPKQPEQPQTWTTSYPQMGQVNNAYPQTGNPAYPVAGNQGYPPTGNPGYPAAGYPVYPPQGGQVNQGYAQSPPPYNGVHPN